MNSRLSQIVASSIGADGKPDRAKIYAELQLTPDAPEAILIDAFVSTDDALRVWRTDAVAAEAALVRAVSEAVTVNFVRQQPDIVQLTAALSATSDRIIRVAFLCGLIAGAAAAWVGTWSWFHFLNK